MAKAPGARPADYVEVIGLIDEALAELRPSASSAAPAPQDASLSGGFAAFCARAVLRPEKALDEAVLDRLPDEGHGFVGRVVLVGFAAHVVSVLTQSRGGASALIAYLLVCLPMPHVCVLLDRLLARALGIPVSPPRILAAEAFSCAPLLLLFPWPPLSHVGWAVCLAGLVLHCRARRVALARAIPLRPGPAAAMALVTHSAATGALWIACRALL